MREIKFRAWDIRTRSFYERPIRLFDSFWHENPSAQMWRIMQCTGLEDIYHEDIVEKTYTLTGKKQIGVVKWFEETLGWGLDLGNGEVTTLDKKFGITYKVLGNTFENPELITNKEE